MAQFTSDILTPEVGARLREARIAKGLTVADAAARLRTTAHYIDRMDAGDVRSLPPEPYRKSFIKEYARLVGLKLEQFLVADSPEDSRPEGILGAVSAMPGVARSAAKEAASLASEVTKSTVKMAGEGVKEAVQELRAKDLWDEVDQVRRERLGIRETQERNPLQVRPREQQAPETAPPPATPRPRVPLGTEEQPREAIPHHRPPTQRVDVDREVRREAESYEPPESDEYEVHTGTSRSTKIIVGLLIVIAAVVAYSVIMKRSKTAPPETAATEVSKTEPQPQPKKAAPIVPKKADSAAASVVAKTSDAALTFSITARENVWVSVTPDVGEGFRGTMNKGETKHFSAKEKYIVYLGNQKAVSMTLAGKPLSGLPTVPGSNMVVRNVLLTRDNAVPASANQSPTEIKKQALKSVAPTKPVPKKATPPAKKHVPPKHTTPPVKKAPPKPAPKAQTNGSVKKRIPVTPPVLPQPN